ncbi:MAG: hypothetical protein U0324_46375 [Polyangiales bacterium]
MTRSDHAAVVTGCQPDDTSCRCVATRAARIDASSPSAARVSHGPPAGHP